MDIQTAIMNRRTIRRFASKPVTEEQLTELVSLARLYASGGNLQPIRFIGVTKENLRNQIFSVLRWAAYLPGFEIPEDNRPMAYLILTCEASKKKSCQFDLGAAATTLMLAAEGEGIATCCLGAFDHQALSSALNLSEDTEPLLVMAMGYPAQVSRSVPFAGDVKYYVGEDGALCVPKRSVSDILQIL